MEFVDRIRADLEAERLALLAELIEESRRGSTSEKREKGE